MAVERSRPKWRKRQMDVRPSLLLHKTAYQQLNLRKSDFLQNTPVETVAGFAYGLALRRINLTQPTKRFFLLHTTLYYVYPKDP
jgi:hypothetical protein